MFIVFNFFALIQAIILALVFVGFYEAGASDYLAEHGLEDFQKNYIIFYLIFLTTGITEILGIKGRVFWLPTWFLAFVLATLIAFRNTIVPYCPGWLFIILSALPVYGILAALNYKFRRRFYRAQTVIKSVTDWQLATQMQMPHKFWKDIRKSVVNPPNLYLYGYKLYKRINSKTVPIEEFDAHNLNLVNALLPIMMNPESEMKLNQCKTMLEYRQQSRVYDSGTDTILRNIQEVVRKHS